MATYLLSVQSTQALDDDVKVLPKVPIGTIVAREPDLMTPMPGDLLELRLPSGAVRTATVASFGVEAWERNSHLYVVGDPENPDFTLTIAGGLRPEELPPGTEVWLADPQYRQGSGGE